MDLAAQLKTLSHHAYCIIGGPDLKASLLSILEKKHKVALRGNPDFFDNVYESFAIDDARAVRAQADTRPAHSSGKKVFVLTMNGITAEAQNALLKLLEEPPEYAHFFLILPSAHLLLPTVKSRLSFLGVDGQSRKGSTLLQDRYNSAVITSMEDILASPVSKRLDLIKKFMEEITKDKRPKQDAIDLINAIQETVHSKGLKGNEAKLEAIETSRKYMNDRSPSLKMLLEYVALSV
jgi:hypothetical protein